MILPNSVLRADVDVTEAAGLPLLRIPKGTPASEIPEDQLAQLCEDHFAPGD